MTLASAHPDPEAISSWETQSKRSRENHAHGVASLMNTITNQCSIRVAERERKYSRTSNESDIVPIKSENRHSCELKGITSDVYGSACIAYLGPSYNQRVD